MMAKVLSDRTENMGGPSPENVVIIALANMDILCSNTCDQVTPVFKTAPNASKKWSHIADGLKMQVNLLEK